MKNYFFFLLFGICFIAANCKTEETKIANLVTFAKAYGYIKYFHPSQEAATLDWNNFSALGATEAAKCKDQKELITTLNKLFKPIAPGVVFSDSQQDFDLKSITPTSIEDYKNTYWQHKGVGTGMSRPGQVYSSVRVNQISRIDESDSFGNLSRFIQPEKYLGKKIKYTGWVKMGEGSKGTGHLWMRVDKSDKTMGFFDNMGENPVKSKEWKQYEIIGEVDSMASKILIGAFLSGKGSIYVDDVTLHYQEGNEWIEIPIKNGDFEASEIGIKTQDSRWYGKSTGYVYKVSTTEKRGGESCGQVAYVGSITETNGTPLYEGHPKFGELIEKEIGSRVFCQIPLNLYGNKEGTYPKSNSFSSLEDPLNKIKGDPSELSVRLGNIVNVYNVFQHFYPYFEVVKVDWEKELTKALEQSYLDQTVEDHMVTLQKMTAALKDGHISIRSSSIGRHTPGISWEWIENKLIITAVIDENLDLKIGDEVTKVNGILATDYIKEIKSKISGGTEGYLNHRAKSLSLMGQEGTTISIETQGKTMTLNRDQRFDYSDTGIAIQDEPYQVLKDNIYYLNLSKAGIKTITSLLPKLQQANGIICDLRGYPNGNHDLISHLLSVKDTSKAWMRVPQIIYPDQEKLVGYENHGWELEPKEPYLGDKNVVFIIDGRAISYAESFMGFIEGYDLATIVGEPTAGTNGNVNPFEILGKLSLSWTGMKVVKHDGSQLHGVGILPDIYVEKTIAGVKAGKDEFLEKALEVVRK